MNGKNGTETANGAVPTQTSATGCRPGRGCRWRCRRSPCARASAPSWSVPGAVRLDDDGRIVGLGNTVIVSDPELIKPTFRADPKVLHAGTGRARCAIARSNSLLGIDEEQHMEQRKLLLPPFKGQRMRAYESMIAEVAAEEIDTLAAGRRVRHSRGRCSGSRCGRSCARSSAPRVRRLRVARRDAAAVDRARQRVSRSHPGSGAASAVLAVDELLKLRAQIDAVLDELIAIAKADPALEDRPDVLALMVQARHEDGSPMSGRRDPRRARDDAGRGARDHGSHTLSWAIERLRRHPEILAAPGREVA